LTSLKEAYVMLYSLKFDILWQRFQLSTDSEICVCVCARAQYCIGFWSTWDDINPLKLAKSANLANFKAIIVDINDRCTDTINHW